MKITVTSLTTALMAMGQKAHTHYISLIGPDDYCHRMSDNHLLLTFHDIESVEDGFVAPTREDIRKVIEFAKDLPEEADLLVHCWAGISRSTAVAIGIACMHDRTPAEALQHIRDIREPTLKKGYMVLPNRRIVGFFDEELGLNGELSRVVDEYYAGLPLIGITTLPNRGGWNTTS